MTPTPLVTTSWLEAHLGDASVRIVEVSAKNDKAIYQEGHIPGALWFYWKDICWHKTDRQFISPEEMATFLGDIGIGPGTTLVLYGDPVQFGTYAFWSLMMAGHADVRLLDGARTKWVNEGRPLTRDIPQFDRVDYPTPQKGNLSMRLGRNEVRERLGRAGCLLLDGRSPEEYSGQSVSPLPGPDHGAERAGRIPGAVHLFFRKLVNEDDTFKTPDELRAIFTSVGALSDNVDEIVCYCRLSHRATLIWTAMTFVSGIENVKIYDGSWTEWGSIVGFPVEK